MEKVYCLTIKLNTTLPISNLLLRKLQQVIFSAICKYFRNSYRTEVEIQIEELREVLCQD